MQTPWQYARIKEPNHSLSSYSLDSLKLARLCNNLMAPIKCSLIAPLSYRVSNQSYCSFLLALETSLSTANKCSCYLLSGNIDKPTFNLYETKKYRKPGYVDRTKFNTNFNPIMGAFAKYRFKINVYLRESKFFNMHRTILRECRSRS